MTDHFEHLNALRLRLSHMRVRLANEKRPVERVYRNVWIRQVEREIENEIAFLAARGIVEPAAEEMSDDELLATLKA